MATTLCHSSSTQVLRLVALAFLIGGACSSAGGRTDGGEACLGTADAAGRDGGSLPDTGAAHTARFPVKNVIFLVKENRTFDNYFGKFPNANGATTGQLCNGSTVQLAPLLDSSPDIDHSWGGALKAYNNGGMNCFDSITDALHPNGTPLAYQVADEEDIPNYYALAKTFVLSDAFFTSMHGPSFPNHLYTIAAQSGGVKDNPYGTNNRIAPWADPCSSIMSCPESGEPGLEPKDVQPLPSGQGVWGCDSDPSTVVPVLDQEGDVIEIYPCSDFQTLGDELTAAGVSWKMYAPNVGVNASGYQASNGYIWTVYDAIRHMRDSSAWQEHVLPTEQFAIDAKAGKLPSVSWISPPWDVSEHPSASTCTGENWTVSLLQALASGPQWGSSAMFITWDDFGGFYDHVAPDQIDRLGLGFRAPLLIVSPYAKAGTVDHTTAEFSSVLRFIEEDFDLPALTDRDRNTTNLLQDFDWNQTPIPLPAIQQRTTTPNGNSGCTTYSP